jgi:hypothetical protein
MSCQGDDYGKIAEWLANSHGVVIDESNVGRLIRSYKDERKEITEAIYAEEVRNTADSDLKMVGSMIDSLFAEYNDALDNGNTSAANQFARTLTQYLEFRKSLLGMVGARDGIQIDHKLILEGLTNKLGQ